VSGSSRAGRREARERAIELAYEAEQRDQDLDTLLASLVLPPDPYTVTLLRAAEQHRDDAEARIAAKARGWTLARMPVLDRLIMRLAVAELLTQPDVPTAVVLAEATELAGRFSTDDSSRFVNGVLAAIGREVRATGS
jgi:transcription antitermination protein NusB